MKKAAVIGFPIKHSWSPDIHNFWLKSSKINGEYKKIKVQPEELQNFILKAKNSGYSGLNVTVPFKEKVAQICDELSGIAIKLGAVNLITFRGGKIFGDNTDGEGFIASVLNKLPNLSFENNSFAILGAGGAAKSIAYALSERKAKKIIIINRDLEKAKKLSEKIGETAEAYSLTDIKKGLKKTTFLINATSMGMSGGPPSIKMGLSGFPSILCFADIVYNPGITGFMQEASLSGIKVIGGIGMLINQAAPSFEAFYGQPPKNPEGPYALLEKKIMDVGND